MAETTEDFLGNETEDTGCTNRTTLRFVEKVAGRKRKSVFGFNLRCNRENYHQGQHTATLKPVEGPEAKITWT